MATSGGSSASAVCPPKVCNSCPSCESHPRASAHASNPRCHLHPIWGLCMAVYLCMRAHARGVAHVIASTAATSCRLPASLTVRVLSDWQEE